MRSFSLLVLCLAFGMASAITVHPAFNVTKYVNGLGTAFAFGISFCPNGDLFYYDGDCLYRFPPHAVGDLNAVPFGPSYKLPTCAGKHVAGDVNTGLICTAQGRLYLTIGWELSPVNGSVLRRAWSTDNHHGIGLDPNDGRLYLALVSYPTLYVENPDLHTSNTLMTVHHFTTHSADGITVGPNGNVYLADLSNKAMAVYDRTTQTLLPGTQGFALSTLNHKTDGTSICGARGSNGEFLIATTADGAGLDMYQISNLANNSAIVSGLPGYADWSSVGPDGCVYFTVQVAGIYRLAYSDGTCPCFSVQVPNSDPLTPCEAATVVVGSQCEVASAYSSSDTAAIEFGSAVGNCNFNNRVPV